MGIEEEMKKLTEENKKLKEEKKGYDVAEILVTLGYILKFISDVTIEWKEWKKNKADDEFKRNIMHIFIEASESMKDFDYEEYKEEK